MRMAHVLTFYDPLGMCWFSILLCVFSCMRHYNWLTLAQSRALLCEHRDTVLSQLSRLGLHVNWEKSKLSPMQRISFLGMELDSVNLTARLSLERAQSMLNCLESFQSKRAVPLKRFQRLLGYMASAAAVTPLGLLHMRYTSYTGFMTGSRDGHWDTYRVRTSTYSVTPFCPHTFSPWSDLALIRAGALDRAPAAVAYQLPQVAGSMACFCAGEDPRRCPIAVVLSFLQDEFERRLSPSTLKVYVATIAAHHDAVDCKSVGKHDLVIRFLRG